MYLLFGFVVVAPLVQYPNAALWAAGGYVALLVLQRRH